MRKLRTVNLITAKIILDIFRIGHAVINGYHQSNHYIYKALNKTQQMNYLFLINMTLSIHHPISRTKNVHAYHDRLVFRIDVRCVFP